MSFEPVVATEMKNMLSIGSSLGYATMSCLFRNAMHDDVVVPMPSFHRHCLKTQRSCTVIARIRRLPSTRRHYAPAFDAKHHYIPACFLASTWNMSDCPSVILCRFLRLNVRHHRAPVCTAQRQVEESMHARAVLTSNSCFPALPINILYQILLAA